MLITETTDNIEQIFKKRDIEDYSGFIEGDYEASLGKKIKILICATESFIVYLDDDNTVEWVYNGGYSGAETFLEKFGLITNKIGLLETLSDRKLSDSEKPAFRRLLAESMARLLDEQDSTNALSILKTAEQILNAKGRRELILSAFWTTVIISVIELLLYIYYKGGVVKKTIICDTLFPLTICSLAGGLGAFIFLMGRSNNLEIEPSIEDKTYRCEGVLRIFYGIICGFIAYLAVNSKLIFGNNSNPKFSVITFLICLICGVSEKIIPGIIKKIENKV